MTRFQVKLAVLLILSIGVFFVALRTAQTFSSRGQEIREGYLYGWDPSYYYFWLRSPLIRGDFDFNENFNEAKTVSPEVFAEIEKLPKTRNGHAPNPYPIGWAVSGLPWFLLAHLLSLLLRGFGVPVPVDGLGVLYELTIALGQLVYAFVGFIFATRFVSTFCSKETSALGCSLVLLASSLFFYQTFDLFWAHNIAFCCAAIVYYLTRNIERLPGVASWVLIGFFSGLLVISRYASAVLLFYPALALTALVLRDRSRVRGALLGGIAFLAVAALQLIAWKIVYGEYLVNPYDVYNVRFNWASPHLLEILISPYHGLFYWHPVTLVGSIAFIIFLLKAPVDKGTKIGLTLALLFTYYVNAAWGCWYYGYAFGSRAFDGVVLVWMLGVAYLLELLRCREYNFNALVLVLLMLALWNVNLMGLAAKRHLPMFEPVTYREMLEHTAEFWRTVS